MLQIKSFKYFAIVLLIINLLIYRIHCEDECNCENNSNEEGCKNCNPNCVFYNNKCIYIV